MLPSQLLYAEIVCSYSLERSGLNVAQIVHSYNLELSGLDFIWRKSSCDVKLHSTQGWCMLFAADRVPVECVIFPLIALPVVDCM